MKNNNKTSNNAQKQSNKNMNRFSDERSERNERNERSERSQYSNRQTDKKKEYWSGRSGLGLMK